MFVHAEVIFSLSLNGNVSLFLVFLSFLWLHTNRYREVDKRLVRDMFALRVTTPSAECCLGHAVEVLRHVILRRIWPSDLVRAGVQLLFSTDLLRKPMQDKGWRVCEHLLCAFIPDIDFSALKCIFLRIPQLSLSNVIFSANCVYMRQLICKPSQEMI